MPSRAENYFRQIVDAADPIARIGQTLTDREQETEYLEFKRAGEEKHNRANWSIALSGFANTEGGVIVWGVWAKPTDVNGTSVDCVKELNAVANPVALEQQLRNWLLIATVDPVQGVDIRSFQKNDGTDTGYVVCLIPQGSNPPYRADLDTAKQYWLRSQDKFVVMPHALLRSLFYPHLFPKISFRVTRAQNLYHIFLTNTGTATAEELTVYMRTIERKFRPNSSSSSPMQHKEPITLHPGQEIQYYMGGISQEQNVTTFDIKLAFYMRHQQPQYGSIEIPFWRHEEMSLFGVGIDRSEFEAG